MQGAQKLRSEAHLQVRRNDEVEAQRRRWTFYGTIKNYPNENHLLKKCWRFGIFPIGYLQLIAKPQLIISGEIGLLNSDKVNKERSQNTMDGRKDPI